MSEPVHGTTRWHQVEEIFHQALDLPDGARSQFLRERCGDDSNLEREVSEILNGYLAQDRLSGMSAALLSEGTRYGAFEIVRKIGEGGMGAVYLARRHEDFEQQAAIKLINGSPAAVALMAERFRQERQILAGLEHPNIARLLDGGVTTAGQPYLVMEFVEGIRLDQYCDAQPLSIRKRLELFREICAAVHFAHQHLVVHRDLKPGNILINERGEPKLLDFGIAKVLTAPGNLPEETLTQTLTMTGGLLLTPQYASPEQIQGLPCTVASDVYSLGVILYELLAGKGPYSSTAGTPAELIASVVTKEAPRPSVTAPESLKAPLRGDLDGIVMKAIAKKPDERYGSVEQLSEDIRRHLEGLPVTAVEGTRLYIARKFVGRHRMAVGAAALIGLTLVAGMAATLWQARVAEGERALAEQRFSDARKLANYLLFSLYDSVQNLSGSLPVRADMANQSLQYLDRLAAAKTTDRGLRLELARGYLRLGNILGQGQTLSFADSLGDITKALESYRKALSILMPLYREAPNDLPIKQAVASANVELAGVLNYKGEFTEGLAAAHKGIQLSDEILAGHPSDPNRQLDAGIAYTALMDLLQTPGGGFVDPSRRDSALDAAQQATKHLNAALAASPTNARGLLALSHVLDVEGVFESARDPRKAIDYFHRSLDVVHRAPHESLPPSVLLSREAYEETRLGWCYKNIGEYREAIPVLRHAQKILDDQGTADPRNAAIVARRTFNETILAAAETDAGNSQEALAAYDRAIRLLDVQAGNDPTTLATKVVRATCQKYAAHLLAAQGRMAEAARYAKASIDVMTKIADDPKATPQNLNEAAILLMETPVHSLRDYPRALRYAQRSVDLSQGKNVVSIDYLAEAYSLNGDGNAALATIRRGFAMVTAPRPGEKPSDYWKTLVGDRKEYEYQVRTGHRSPSAAK